MRENISEVAKKWQEELTHEGYEKRVNNQRDFLSVIKLSRTWRIILKIINLKQGSCIFELGCGNGKQLIPLSLRGYKCFGIDCSEIVLSRCRNLISDVEKIKKRSIDIKLFFGDFLNFVSSDKYDLVFNFGVIEHFLDDIERNKVIYKMFDLCSPGGYVVSVVPNGQHPLREIMKKEKLGGYHVPEIDYSCETLVKEMKKVGLKEVKVIPHDFFGYLLRAPNMTTLKRLLYYSIYSITQLLPRIHSNFTCKYANTLICIARKEL